MSYARRQAVTRLLNECDCDKETVDEDQLTLGDKPDGAKDIRAEVSGLVFNGWITIADKADIVLFIENDTSDSMTDICEPDKASIHKCISHMCRELSSKSN